MDEMEIDSSGSKATNIVRNILKVFPRNSGELYNTEYCFITWHCFISCIPHNSFVVSLLYGGGSAMYRKTNVESNSARG